MKRLKRCSDINDKSGINNLVNNIIQIYYENDYDYVVSLSKKGEKPETNIKTIEDEIKFIETNNLNSENLSYEDLEIAADIIRNKIYDIDNEIYLKYNKKRWY